MGAVIAVSSNVPGEVSLYSVVLFLHILAAVVGFGAAFLYPVFFRMGRRADRRNLPLFHRVQVWFGPRVITTAATVILLAGIYMATTGPYELGDPFVGAGILIIVVILGLGGGYFSPKEARLLELSERDIAASAAAAEVSLSDDYLGLSRQVERMTWVVAGLVTVAIFLMVTKLGA